MQRIQYVQNVYNVYFIYKRKKNSDLELARNTVNTVKYGQHTEQVTTVYERAP